MRKSQKANKRIVSKAEYAKVQGKRTGLRLGAGVLYLLAMFLTLNAVSCMMTLLFILFKGRFFAIETLIYTAFFVLTGTGAYFCLKWAKASMHRVAEMGKIVPLTRANTANLPAPDSLVRASAEPVQEPQSVLLRAAENTETPVDQLVRAVHGVE